MNGFKYIKNKPTSDIESWSIINRSDITLSDSIFKLYASEIDGKIVKKNSCLLTHFTLNNGSEWEINLECYNIEWVEKKENYRIQHYMYIPKKDIDNLIRRKKIEWLLKK